MAMATNGAGATLVYDGECPFCSAYVKYVRVRESVGGLKLVDARSGEPPVDEIRRRGYDLDEGMVLVIGNRFYHGADCINALAMLSSESSAFNRLNAAVFKSERLSKLLYPALRFGRNTTLRLLGRRKMGSSADAAAPARE